MRKRPGEELKAPSESKIPRLGKKFKLIHQTTAPRFCRHVRASRKEVPTNFGSCDLYVTDYTENKEMFYYSPPEDTEEHERDGDRFSYTGAPKRAFQGPFGFLTLKIRVKDPHAHYANTEIAEGDFVHLQNVKMRYETRLEGDMWPDDLNPRQGPDSEDQKP